MEKELNIISLGAGVQSSTMALMAAHGELTPQPDYAIFADTQWEPLEVYEHLAWLESVVSNPLRSKHYFPILKVTQGNIKADTLEGKNSTGQNFVAMPLFTENGGLIRRQCTAEYKIKPIRKEIRTRLGLKPRQRVSKNTKVNLWMGISTDEASRMKPSRDAWLNHTFPLIDHRMSRFDCLKWFEKRYPKRSLTKSACVGCPYRSNSSWRDMKINDPETFDDAIKFDAKIRNVGQMKEKKHRLYVHQSCQPLSEVDFRNLEDKGQLNMFENECEGYCGV